MQELRIRHAGRAKVVYFLAIDSDEIIASVAEARVVVRLSAASLERNIMHPSRGLLAKSLTKWLNLLPTRSLGRDEIRRWGFLDYNWELHESAHHRPYGVARIVASSGTRHGWMANRYYASSTTSGGPSTFWPIDFFTLDFADLEMCEGPGSPIASDIEERPESSDDAPLVQITRDPLVHARCMWRLDRWCMRHLDESKKIQGPGYRSSSAQSSQYHVPGSSIFCYSPYGNCLRAAVVNSLCALDGTSVGREMLKREASVRGVYRTLALG